MAGDIPLVRIGPADIESFSVSVSCTDIVHVFCKFMQGVSSRGSTAHTNRQWPVGYAMEGHGNFSFMMNGVGKRNMIIDLGYGGGDKVSQKEKVTGCK